MSKLVVDATGNDLTYRIIGAAMTVTTKSDLVIRKRFMNGLLKMS
jgi:hypothetical protein